MKVHFTFYFSRSLQQYSTPVVIEQLSNAVQEAENSSDEVTQKFLAGEMDLKDFQKEFYEKRKLYHLRAAKKERMMVWPSK
jgi:hypothetical protein